MELQLELLIREEPALLDKALDQLVLVGLAQETWPGPPALVWPRTERPAFCDAVDVRPLAIPASEGSAGSVRLLFGGISYYTPKSLLMCIMSIAAVDAEKAQIAA